MTGGFFWNDEVQDVLVPRNPNYPNGYVGGPPNANNTVPNTHSSDPNGKLTVGYGTQGYIAPNVAIPYTIYFENLPAATAPAQIVTVTDNLDPNLDWTTVQLSQIEFNNVTIDVPSGLNTYSGLVNVSTDPNPVKVNVSFDPSTGVLYWLMQSVDPVTGEMPTDPTAGFLPPNNSSNQGTGYVIFTVLPKSLLSNGAVINNQASIVFDVNAAIVTNSVTNTIDATVPTSAVNALPATTTATSFSISWTGSDTGGSGIANYTVYVSIDGGSYSLWQSATALTSATFTATAGHTYRFYSMATSNVGTVQTTPGAIQTTQILQTYTVTPVAGTGGTISPNTAQTITINNTTSLQSPEWHIPDQLGNWLWRLVEWQYLHDRGHHRQLHSYRFLRTNYVHSDAQCGNRRQHNAQHSAGSDRQQYNQLYGNAEQWIHHQHRYRLRRFFERQHIHHRRNYSELQCYCQLHSVAACCRARSLHAGLHSLQWHHKCRTGTIFSQTGTPRWLSPASALPARMQAALHKPTPAAIP